MKRNLKTVCKLNNRILGGLTGWVLQGLLILLVTGVFNSAVSQFTVSKPVQGATLYAGSHGEIEWSGATAGSYDIFLQVYEGFFWNNVTTLYQNTWLNSSGNLLFTVPTVASETSDYRIDVRYNWDWTSSNSGTFSILNSLPSATNVFPPSGNTGIGTISPNRPIHVVGDARATGNIRSGDTVAIDTGRRLLVADGTAGTPAFRFSAENGVGMYRAGSNDLRLVTAGGNRLRFTNSYVRSYVRHRFADGTAGSPGLNFASNTNTGIWRPAGRIIGFSTNGTERIRINENGYLGIGTKSPTDELSINGDFQTREIIITQQSSDWPDYVFDPDYMLKGLLELEAFIAENRHLPEIPAAREINEQGQNLGEIQRLLLKKIEELTLYMILMKNDQDGLLDKYSILFDKINRLK